MTKAVAQTLTDKTLALKFWQAHSEYESACTPDKAYKVYLEMQTLQEEQDRRNAQKRQAARQLAFGILGKA